MCNSPEIQVEIAAIIDSCKTERGGFDRRFFESFHIAIPTSFRIPKGWKKDLELHGDAEALARFLSDYQRGKTSLGAR